LATYLYYFAEITRKPMTPRGRFLIVWAKDREEYYVQCLFFDDDRQIRCEGASGYYYDEIKGYVTATKGEVLAELGFSTDASAGNIARELRVDELGTRAIAKLIIELLARVYDLGSDNLEYAPLLSSKKGNPVIVALSCQVGRLNDSGPAPIKRRLFPSGSHNGPRQTENPTGG